MQWRTDVQYALQLRNARARHISSLLDEVNTLKSELVAATIAKKALERQAVVTVLASGHGDISGLLADTPLPPHLCAQLAAEVQNMLIRAAKVDASSEDVETETIMMRDPVFRAATERIIIKFLLSGSGNNSGSGCDENTQPIELRVATLENEFAGLVCEALLNARSISGYDFDLPRMLRMLTAFRSMVADACYGGITRPSDATESSQTAKDDAPAMMDPVEAVAARKARLAVTHEAGPTRPMATHLDALADL
jgi:hypothetical protein